jgi:beta-glucosidase
MRRFPDGFKWGVATSAFHVPLFVTENGSVFAEPVHDARRIDYIHDHLAAMLDAIDRGANVLGYCHWSLIDNVDWALGCAQRFGLVHVDYDTLERTAKDGARYYEAVARSNALVEELRAG